MSGRAVRIAVFLASDSLNAAAAFSCSFFSLRYRELPARKTAMMIACAAPSATASIVVPPVPLKYDSPENIGDGTAILTPGVNNSEQESSIKGLLLTGSHTHRGLLAADEILSIATDL